VLLLQSANGRNPDGLANSSDQIGRNFMNHNATFMLAIDPFAVNDAVYQKTLHFNDFYFDYGNGSGPIGQVQLLGRVTEPILKPIRRVIPSVGGLDLSPLIVFVIIFFLQNLINFYAARAAVGAL